MPPFKQNTKAHVMSSEAFLKYVTDSGKLIEEGESIDDACGRIMGTIQINDDLGSALRERLVQDGYDLEYTPGHTRLFRPLPRFGDPVIGMSSPIANKRFHMSIPDHLKPNFIVQDNPKENQQMAKTMYDTHLGGNAATGTEKATPIFMMDDAHLENTIRVKAKNFCITRQRFSDAPRATDPMVTAMGSVQAWNADALQKHTRAFMEDFQAYVCEAVVRGGTILAQAQESLREVTRRDSAVVIESQALLELESETLEEP